MRKLLKVVGWLFFAVLVVILLGLVFVFIRFPKSQDPPDVTVEATPERVARGEYLYRSVVVCDYCHGGVETGSAYNWVVPGTEGQGGHVFDLGPVGTVYARNITPTALETWTDGQLIRAMRDGVNAKGQALFPIMPYHAYRELAQEDVYAVVAYVRQLVPKPDQVPPRGLKLPLSLIVRFMPSPAPWPPETTAPPDTSDTVATGRYYADMLCASCHTTTDNRGNPLPGREFAGNTGFPERGWIANPANITPDSVTGIGRWSRDDFIRRFKSMETTAAPAPAAPDVPRTSMPWLQFATMTESDLGAIYDYLRTVPPVENRVEKYERIPAPGGE